jgi:hypothetical protein
MRELNVSLEILKSYESQLIGTDFRFNVVNQQVPEDVYMQVLQIHRNIPVIQEKKQLLVFKDKNNYRFTAKVKWYYNKQTEGEYGFIEKAGIPDVYFAGNTFMFDDPKKIQPGDIVVVTLAKEDLDDKKQEIKALAVNFISSENDLNFLLFYFINYFKRLTNDKIESLLENISKNSNQFDETIVNSLETIIAEEINHTTFKQYHYQAIYSLLKICKIDLNTTSFWSRLSEENVFNYWINCPDLVIEFSFIYNKLLNYTKANLKSIYSYFSRVDNDYKKMILDSILQETFSIDQEFDISKVLELISIYDEFEIQFDLDKIPEALHLQLWEQDKVYQIPFNAVYNQLLDFKDEYYNYSPGETNHKSKYQEYFDKIDSLDLKNLIAKTYYDKDTIDDNETFKTVLFFIHNIKNRVDYDYYIDIIYNKSSAYYRLLLFIEDVTELIDYHQVVIYTGLLSSRDQKLFFKKVLKLIAEHKLDLSIEDLNRITTIDYQTSEYAKEIDGVGLDFTLSVILKLITDLKSKITTSRIIIFDLVANQIKTPKDLLVIDGFFEKCSGKTIIEENGTKKLEDGTLKTIYKTTKKEHFLPRFSIFCDGRKAVLKGSTEPILCKKSGLEFWWCENSQCYDVCRKPHPPTDWKSYTLEDVLQILKIPYEVTQYEILLNVVNRVNRFLSHLSCRKCNSILKPKGKSNYTFYGVSMFSCKNKDCEEYSKDIYLSHCLNGLCEDIIDSRDSVKCKTQDYEDECGWYICKNCNACCSSEKLITRKNNLAKLGQEYKCHLVGHRDRGIICCSDCGHEMIVPVASVEIYNKQLNWFIEHKDNHPNIYRSGQRKNDNKWWFIWSRGNMSYEDYRKQIQSLFESGFSIPDFNNKEKDNQLIAEPFEEKKLLVDKVFVCPNCDHHLDLNNKEDFNYNRKRAIQSFHNKIFPVVDN